MALEQISEDSGRRRHLPNNQRQHENDSRAETIAAETAARCTKPPNIQHVSVADDTACDCIPSERTVCIVYCCSCFLALPAFYVEQGL